MTGSEAHDCGGCLICFSSEARTFIHDPKGGRLVSCRNDGFVYRWPLTPACAQEEAYKDYVPSVKMFSLGRMPALEKYARLIQDLKPRGRIVDVGCSIGTFLSLYPQDRYERLGIEPSEFNVRETLKKGIPAFVGVLSNAGIAERSIDVVTMFDTVMFLPNPRCELREARRILRDDGILCIEIEGWNYWRIRSRGPVCWVLNRSRLRLHPMQLYFFRFRHLKALLESEGFRVMQRVPGPASASESRLVEVVNKVHRKMADALRTVSGGRFSFAARDMVIAKIMK